VVATLLWLAVSLGLKLYIAYFGNFNETYGTLAGFIVLLTWFYLSGLAILIGAELNAEIEHASPYGKDVGEKVPGEKKKIGPAAARAYEERKATGASDAAPFPDDVNCDIDREAAHVRQSGLRPSDLLIGSAILAPAAVTMAKGIKNKISQSTEGTRETDAA
jgi:membrane protein